MLRELMTISGIGIDTIEISRFRMILRKKKDRFIENTFSETERKYCLSFKDAATHFAGTFAAKEAIRKASGIVVHPFSKIEIRRRESGKPEVWLDGQRSKSLLISISHNKSTASAIALHR